MADRKRSEVIKEELGITDTKLSNEAAGLFRKNIRKLDLETV
jgi:hypothetical protein